MNIAFDLSPRWFMLTASWSNSVPDRDLGFEHVKRYRRALRDAAYERLLPEILELAKEIGNSKRRT